MATFEDVLKGFGGNTDEFVRAYEAFMDAEYKRRTAKVEAHAEAKEKGDAAAEPEKKPAKKARSSPGGKNPKVVAALEKEVEKAMKEADDAAKEATQNVGRVSPVMSKELEKILTDAGILRDEKQFKKLKDEFRGYVNELTDDDFKKSSLTDHMRDFANLKKEEKEPEKKEKPARKPRAKKVKVEAHAEAKEKVEAHAKAEEKVEAVEAKAEAEPAKGGGAANVDPTVLTYAELMERSKDRTLYATEQGGGVFWDPDAGEMVTGPDEDADEEMEEEEFEGKTYAVGQKTGRVYAQDDEGLDIFVGFKGVGKFKHM